MSELRRRFGRLVAANRRRRGLTQEQLAEAADIGPDMIAKIETGITAARFPLIERLAEALAVDPAEFFTADLPQSTKGRKPLHDLTVRLANLPDNQITWVARVVDAALLPLKKPAPSPGPRARAPRRTSPK